MAPGGPGGCASTLAVAARRWRRCCGSGDPDPSSREQLVTETAALAFAEDHQLAAPRLLAADLDLDGAAGRPMLLSTVLAGSSRIPAVASPARLWALAAPRPRSTPWRPRQVPACRCGPGPWPTWTSPLSGAPAGVTEFVHGDLWQGNTVWACEALVVGMVDWDAAGAGHPGVDLGSLRLDAAILFGLPAAAEVLEGRRQAIGTGLAGEAMADLAYWDVAAALTSPTDMGQWVPVAHQHGRGDLDAVTLRDRRDAFLRAALEQLDRE